MTIKEAFQKLALSLSVSLKNPFFVNKRLYNDFAEIAEDIEEGGSGSTHDYSTDEQVIGKWIDGTDLYEITGTISSEISTQESVVIDGTDLNISVVTEIIGVVHEDGNSYLPTNVNFKYNAATKKVTVYTSQYTYGDGATVTIRYTKSAS